MNAMRGGATLLLGNGAGFFLRFVRNIAVARLISVEDYGIASTFVVAMSFVQMSTDLNFKMLVVQNRDGDAPDFIAAIQLLNAVRGVLVGLILLLTAAPIARLMGQPELIWAYQMMAIIPVVGGFAHTDRDRFQRTMRFGPLVGVNLATLTLTLIAVWPLALWLGDFRVMLGLYLIEVVLRLALSHAVAERPFRMLWNAGVALQAVRFGWPLLLGGSLLFAGLQGDRIIVANQFGAEQLGLFSAAINLTMPASLQVADLTRTFFLPLLSRFQDQADEFRRRAAFALQATLCTSMLGVLGFAFLGPAVLAWVFGPRYEAAAAMVGLVGAIFALRILRAGTTTIAIARGHTLNMLVINIVRILFLPPAVFMAIEGATIIQILALGVVGEVAAIATSLFMLRRQERVTGLRYMRLPYAFGIATLAAVCAELLISPGNVAGPDALSGLAVLAFVGTVLSSRIMIVELSRLLKKRRKR